MQDDPLRAAADHHRLMIDHMAKARAHENCIKRLLVGRLVQSELYVRPLIVTDVQVKGLEVHVFGRANPKRKRSILLAVQLAALAIVDASKEDASSMEKARNELAAKRRL